MAIILFKCEQKNVIDVFTYATGDRVPEIEKIQTFLPWARSTVPTAAACPRLPLSG
ncbi:MAG: hypothetical protein ACLUD2_02415 [Clostridium sp.]